ncbi:transglycosylase SLT domain-containing protein [Priestia sp. YIM B13551]|uniref:transglycosylase SLT domain-containing protein n=1 Tax=Priestia sp. YIM B13551 TaxID=3366306 RepID=UPI00366C026F
MATKTKQEYNKKRYIDILREGKKGYDERRDFLKEFSLKTKKTTAATTTNGETSDSGGGSVVLNGDMPTISQYQGPDNYYDDIIGKNYQTGLKGKLKGTDKWNKDIKEQAAKTGVNPLLIKVLMATESGGSHSSNPNPWNCVGLMQVQGATAKSLGLNWDKVRNDPVYNIYAGCMVAKSKHKYAEDIIRNNGSKYASYKKRGYELKANCHGVAWLFNGFSVPTKTSNKVTSGGYVYGNQIVAMLKGFGRDGHKDTVYTTDVLGGSGSSSSGSTSSSSGASAKAQAKLSIKDTSSEVEVTADYPIREPLTEEEAAFMQKESLSYQVPVGVVKGDYFRAPKSLRDTYVEDRKQSKLFIELTNYAPLPTNEFIHLSGPQENYYAPEAREVFKLLRNRLGYGQMVVTRGFEPLVDSNDSSHSVGIAMDIYAPTAQEALRIADTAWLLGVRSIAIGPKFVHVDTGPEATWGYDNLAIYRGPGTIKVGGLSNGFK